MSPSLAVPAVRHALTRASAVGALALLAACAPVTRRGLDPIVTDRPDFTESTETVPTGMKQLEAGSTFANAEYAETATLGEALLRVGTSAHTELRIGLNSYALTRGDGPTPNGFEDISIGTKVKLLSSGGTGSLKPALAVIIATSVPTGMPGMSDRKPLPEVKFGMAWDLTERVAFSSNLNYSRAVSEFGDYDEYAATGSLGIGISDRIGSYVEYFTFQPTRVPIPANHYVNGGFTYGFTDNLQLDVRGGYGVHHHVGPDFFMGLGISRRW